MIAETLQGLGVAADAAIPLRAARAAPALSAADLRRLASARARVAIRGAGSFEVALIASEAPMTALRFVRLVESGYYNGLTFHRVVPNLVIQGGSPGANEYVGDATFMRDELGQWPHVRGAVGISTRGRDTGDAQIFVDLVDNPRFDHEYTVFAHVLNGMEVVDAILEGDVIEKIDIVGGSW
jgi:peptidyl-prolyl cis-trans isomerase B (cyclophilin B)